jgi:hypothetical protein
MAKRARIRKLEGRVVESVIIHYSDPGASQPEWVGPSLEIRVSGGYVLVFTAQQKPVSIQAEACIYRDNNGNTEDEVRATVTENGFEYE